MSTDLLPFLGNATFLAQKLKSCLSALQVTEKLFTINGFFLRNNTQRNNIGVYKNTVKIRINFITSMLNKTPYCRNCWWLDSNPGPLVSEETGLPTVSQFTTISTLQCFLCSWRTIFRSFDKKNVWNAFWPFLEKGHLCFVTLAPQSTFRKLLFMLLLVFTKSLKLKRFWK